jgi:hypothetical protein
LDTGEEEPNLCEHRESVRNFEKDRDRLLGYVERPVFRPQKRRANVVALPKVDTNW